MDLDGNIGFKRSDGGKIILQEFTSATGRQGSWSPSPGQGNTIALDGNGPVQSANSNHDVKSINYTSSSPTESLLSYIPIEGAEIPLSGISILTQSDSESTLSVIDYALDYVAAERSNLGAIQNRLTHTIDNLTNIVTNTEASQSKILDADYAKETTELTRTQIIQQAATAMLAQANQSAQIVLELLR
jgi:flagellin-like hook-associated protein FlgL